MPICYLMHKDIPDEILFKVFQWHLKYVDFEVLKKPTCRFETEGQSFFCELISSGRATVKNMNLIKPQLLVLSVDDIEILLFDVSKTETVLSPEVEKFLAALRTEVIVTERKKSKVPSLFIFHKLK